MDRWKKTLKGGERVEQQKIKWRMEPVQAENKAKLYIYDDVTEYGEFNWDTWEYEDSETSARYMRDRLSEIPEDQEIELHINSNGGSVKEGVAIYNLLRQAPNKKTGIVDGVAHSVAFLILQACDVRKMGIGTSALVHNMWMYVAGNAARLRKAADDLDDLMETNRQIFLQRATITEDELRQIMDAETYLTPERALEYGLIDEIIGKIDREDDQRQAGIMQKMVSMLQRQIAEQKSFREEMKMFAKSVPEASGEEVEIADQKEDGLLNFFKAEKAGKEV